MQVRALSGKPYLPQLVPLVALVREQRFAPASAGDAFIFLLAESRLAALSAESDSSASLSGWRNAWFSPARRDGNAALALRPDTSTPIIDRRRTRLLPHTTPTPIYLMTDAAPSERKAMRQLLRARRRAVSATERARAAQLVARNADGYLHLRAGWRIAIYVATPTELDTSPLIDLARRRDCVVYVPRIDRHSASHKMRFVELTGRQRRNRLGIHEPEGSVSIGARWLDVVFLPLVGFDARGVRLGMGGGYYDRAFAFRLWRTAWHAPRLIGLAYSFQQVDGLVAAPHDVRLDAVVTEERIVQCAIG